MASARNLFQDLLSTIADFRADFRVDFHNDLRQKFSSNADGRAIDALSLDLLSGNDDTSIQRLGKLILGKYEQLDDEAKRAFFRFLTDEMDLDIQGIKTSSLDYEKERNAKTLQSLMRAAEPRRQDFLRRLNQVAGATEILVGMRADLLRFAKDDASLKIADSDFAHLFTSWFNRGFLTLMPISWHTPANILGKIIKYEAVHAINDWDDLRRRLQPQDRRCFAFFHPAMPYEPLVFVEVALCKGLPSSIQSVLAERDEALMIDDVDTAAFYSISNCQRGLQGISFGNSLIKQVVTDLAKEIPSLKHFVTLSPVPGFAKWLADHPELLPQAELPLIKEAAKIAQETNDKTQIALYDTTLTALAAQYLTKAKRKDGQPLDSVARFHLRNGASVHRLHGMADLSDNGVANAYGIMVNYHYDLPHVAMRHENYVRHSTVEAHKKVSDLASTKPSTFYLQTGQTL